MATLGKSVADIAATLYIEDKFQLVVRERDCVRRHGVRPAFQGRCSEIIGFGRRRMVYPRSMEKAPVSRYFSNWRDELPARTAIVLKFFMFAFGTRKNRHQSTADEVQFCWKQKFMNYSRSQGRGICDRYIWFHIISNSFLQAH